MSCYADRDPVVDLMRVSKQVLVSQLIMMQCHSSHMSIRGLFLCSPISQQQ